jgi:hypothetical protein
MQEPDYEQRQRINRSERDSDWASKFWIVVGIGVFLIVCVPLVLYVIALGDSILD